MWNPECAGRQWRFLAEAVARTRHPGAGPGRITPLLHIAVVMILTGCSGPVPADDVVAHWDSAGVHVERVTLDESTIGGDIRVDTTAVRTFGTDRNGFIAVTGAGWYADGGLVVADGGSRRLVRYSPEGNHGWSVGRRGEGPGEFNQIAGVLVQEGDTVLVYDAMLARLTRISPEGRVIEVHPVEADVPKPPLKAVLLPGPRLLHVSGVGFGVGAESGFHRPDYQVGLHDLMSGSGTALGSWPGSGWHVESANRQVSVDQAVLSPDTYVAGRGETIMILESESGSLEVREVAGEVRHRIKLQMEPASVTSTIHQAAIEARLEGIRDPGQRDRTRRRLEAAAPPARLPFFGGMVVDSDGHAWLSHHVVPGVHLYRNWDVITSDGRHVGRVRLPVQVEPVAIRTDRMLVRHWGRDGTETVKEYRIERDGDRTRR